MSMNPSGRGPNSTSSPPSEQIRREVATGDLRRRPPERISGADDLRVGARHVRAHEQRLLAGEQLPSQDGPKRRRLDGGAVARGDLLGHGIRLLGREPTLLDRELDRVAGRVHVGEPLHPPALVDRDEPVQARVAGTPASSWAAQERQRDDVIGARLPEGAVASRPPPSTFANDAWMNSIPAAPSKRPTLWLELDCRTAPAAVLRA